MNRKRKSEKKLKRRVGTVRVRMAVLLNPKIKCSNTDKTQHEDLSADAKKAGNMAEVGPGRVTP